MAKSYYQRAHGIVITCALNNKGSFYNLKNWLSSIKDNTQADSIQFIIIANKCDLIEDREVNSEEIESKAKEINAEYFETSAKENINVDEAFNTIIDKVYKNVYNPQKGFELDGKKNSFKSGCC